jgi:radical SAM family uncharacterized protein/radical SAM-linked protein
LGNEINTVKKPLENVEITFGLAFPDVYEVGMSHQGLKIIYDILNRHEWLAAELVFCPWVDMEGALRREGLPLQTQESGIPLGKLDILGFSLQHELCYSNVLTMLELGGVPLRADERDTTYPLILAGGPACFNPEPFAEIFDLILIGDGEEKALEICRLVRHFKKKSGMSKKDLLADLSHVQGIYVPSFFQPEYGDNGILTNIRPLIPAYSFVTKALVPDIDKSPFPAGQIVPYSDPVHDRLSVEICRGCTRGCRFCQAGMVYRPVRERDQVTILHHIEEGLRLTGYDEVSLLSLSSGDYSAIGPLLRELMNRRSRDKIAVSLPSLRIDSLDEAWLEQIKRVRKTGFTLAPEAGSDRLRRVINKTLTNEEILETAEKVYNAGWKLIKLYFMIGLPGETEEDLQEIITLSKGVARTAVGRGKKPILHVSVAAFVPKPHTPFMWLPQITLEESRRRIRKIQDGLLDHRIRVKWNNPEMSWIEGIFSRGDRRLLGPLIRAWENGARFDAWGEHFHLEIWKEAFEAKSIDPDFYLYRTRARDEIMPWEHIRSGVHKTYLFHELERSQKEKTTPDCRLKCLECGVCDHDQYDPVIQKNRPFEFRESERPQKQSYAGNRSYFITFSKTETARYLGHLELARSFMRALRRTELQVSYTGGFHPTPKISFTTALPVGTESLEETVKIELIEPIDPEALTQKLNRSLPPGIRVIRAEDRTGKKKKEQLLETHFRIRFDGIDVDKDTIDGFIASREFIVKKTTSKGEREVDARRLVRDMKVKGRDTLELVLLNTPGTSLKPAEILGEIFHLDSYQVLSLRILKLKQVMG